jgi:hypothetical protein
LRYLGAYPIYTISQFIVSGGLQFNKLGVKNEGVHEFRLGEWLRDDFVGTLGDKAGDIFR